MGLALFLVVLVVLELALTVWFLARQREYRGSIVAIRGRVSKLERNVVKMAEVLRDLSEDAPDMPVSDDGAVNLADLVSKATPEDFEQAQEVLRSLGLGQAE